MRKTKKQKKHYMYHDGKESIENGNTTSSQDIFRTKNSGYKKKKSIKNIMRQEKVHDVHHVC